MRLLIVTQTLDKNDPILGFFHEWVRGFASRFEKVTVIALNVGEHDLPKNVAIETLGKEVGMERTPRMLRYLALLVNLRNEYTHVFAHMNPEYVIGGGLVWRLFRKKIAFWYMHGKVSMRLKIAVALADKVFTASKESCRVKDKKITVVGHGIDIDLFSPGTVQHTPTIVSTGRLSPSKYSEVLIEAYSLLKKQGIPLSFLLVGDSGRPEERAYAEDIKKRAESVGVNVLGSIANAQIPNVLRTSDVFLSASATGSLDKAVLEAMAVGVVPVTSNPAFESMLSPLHLFVERNPESFARRTKELFQDTGVRMSLSKKVREEIVKNHSLTRLMDVLQKSFASM